MSNWLNPATLTGQAVRLEPLSMAHLPELIAVGLDPAIWALSTDVIDTPAALERYVVQALAEQERGVSLPFATVSQASNTVIGSTRFGNCDAANRSVEIGWTWIIPAWQRSAINTEAKLLMLRHAFTVLHCMRVELKTDRLNTRSQQAIERLGATREGTFRKHRLLPSGRVRDSVYFSIVDDEWPSVEATLEARLARGANPAT